MKPESNPIERLANQALADQLFMESKAVAGGGLPFPGQGGGEWSGVPVYSSWDAWDSAINIRYGGTSDSAMKYANKIGDLAQSSLICAAIRWFGNVLPQAKLQVKKSTGEKGASEPVPDHPLVKLWKRPNDYYSGSTLLKGIAFSWVMRSQAFILKFFNNAGTEPVELWWEPHWTIRAVYPQDGSEFISKYQVLRNGIWKDIPVENVIHLRDGLSPYNQREGFSGIPSILREIFADQAAAAYYATLMGGSGIPGFMVSLDASMAMQQPDIDAFTRDIINKTSGKNKGQPIVVKGGRAYKLGLNPRELDLREGRYAAEERFCAVMGIPGVVLELGSAQEHSIYNNVKQAEGRAWDDYVNPFLNHLEEELNVQLLEDFEGEGSQFYVSHDLTKVPALQEDEDAKSKRLTEQWDKGIIMRSEARSGLGYGPSDPANEDADKVFKVNVSSNLLKPGEDVPERVTESMGQPTANQPAASVPPEQPKKLLRAVPRPGGKVPAVVAKALGGDESITAVELAEAIGFMIEPSLPANGAIA